MNIETHSGALDTFRRRLDEAERFQMGEGKVHETLQQLGSDLEAAGIDYAIVDGMALNAHGYRRETVDLDVLVRPDGLDSFRVRFEGRGYVARFDGTRKSFRNARTGVCVEFLTTGEYPGDGKPKPVAFPDPRQASIDIEGVRVVDLPTLVNLKLASGMTQPSCRRDLADVQDLIRTLSLDDTFADRIDPYVREMYLTLLSELRHDDPHAD